MGGRLELDKTTWEEESGEVVLLQACALSGLNQQLVWI